MDTYYNHKIYSEDLRWWGRLGTARRIVVGVGGLSMLVVGVTVLSLHLQGCNAVPVTQCFQGCAKRLLGGLVIVTWSCPTPSPICTVP